MQRPPLVRAFMALYKPMSRLPFGNPRSSGEAASRSASRRPPRHARRGAQ